LDPWKLVKTLEDALTWSARRSENPKIGQKCETYLPFHGITTSLHLHQGKEDVARIIKSTQNNKKERNKGQKSTKRKNSASRGSRTPTDWMETSHSTAKLSTPYSRDHILN
jgi:hypothetical protein